MRMECQAVVRLGGARFYYLSVLQFHVLMIDSIIIVHMIQGHHLQKMLLNFIMNLLY